MSTIIYVARSIPRSDLIAHRLGGGSWCLSSRLGRIWTSRLGWWSSTRRPWAGRFCWRRRGCERDYYFFKISVVSVIIIVRFFPRSGLKLKRPMVTLIAVLFFSDSFCRGFFSKIGDIFETSPFFVVVARLKSITCSVR